MAKARYKLQRRNSGDAWDRNWYGNKRWINCGDNSGANGWNMTYTQASALYWRMRDDYPAETYRIVEVR